MDITKAELLKQNDMLDALTGIYNRKGFYHYTREMLDQNPNEAFCLVYWNIRKFKVINNLFGRDAGDKILIQVADAIRKEFGGGNGTYGRLERDNFICCIREDVIRQGDWLHAGEITYLAEDSEYHFFSCFGLYKIEDTSLKVSSMVDKARVAMETVKNNYMEPYAWYDESMWGSIVEEQKLNSDFRRAIEEKQFQVYYQPICRAEDGVITGAEALVRWIHPERGVVSPGEFIPIFEKNGFISVLDFYVWEEVCRMLQTRRNKGLKVVPVSVNVSRVEFYNYHLCEEIRDLVQKYELPTDLLKIEITETAYSESPTRVQEAVKKLHDYGFVVLMDDFGSGYSSLNMLKEMPLDIIKMDLKFLDGGENVEKSRNILQTLISLAQSMQLFVVVEGVETIEQVEFLKGIGNCYLQGYYFSRPVDYEAYEALLTRERTENKNVKSSSN